MSKEINYASRLINWHSRSSNIDALNRLLSKAELFRSNGDPGQNLLVFSDGSDFAARLVSQLKDAEFIIVVVEFASVPLSEDLLHGSYCGVLMGTFDVSKCHSTAKYLQSSVLNRLPIEYFFRPIESYELLLKEDIFDDVFFVSPLLIREVDVFGIYEESLRKFDKKCQIRDYLDLALSLLEVHRREVPGDIAEFGSYRGHSGYLICRILEALGSVKKCYMFDTFEGFPDEDLGIDYLWNDTHDVVFESVKSKFEGISNVVFVQGDFTKTFDVQGIDELAMAFVDCDSFRGTEYLCDRLFQTVVSPGGLMVFEDYGHPPLLGNRLAFHNFFDERWDCFVFFSQFSGAQVVGKR